MGMAVRLREPGLGSADRKRNGQRRGFRARLSERAETVGRSRRRRIADARLLAGSDAPTDDGWARKRFVSYCGEITVTRWVSLFVIVRNAHIGTGIQGSMRIPMRSLVPRRNVFGRSFTIAKDGLSLLHGSTPGQGSALLREMRSAASVPPLTIE